MKIHASIRKNNTVKQFNLSLGWEWLLCVATLTMLAAALLGYDVFGLSGPLATGVGFVVSLVVTITTIIVGFILSAIIIPILAMAGAFLAAVLAAFTMLLGLMLGSIVLPLTAFFTGILTSLIGWFATTWLGTLLMPVYSLIAPLVLKVAPWITTSKYAAQVWDKVDDIPTVRKTLKKLKVPGYVSKTKGRGKATPAATKRAQSK